jgi:hypothetical protein
MFSHWESFYVIVGSSSAALTGLMFVVITLTPESRTPASEDTLGAFATPNVVHFCAVLLISALLSAPWEHVPQPAAVVDVIGLAGLVYVTIVFRRARRQTTYHPVFEDWVWHMFLPFVAYATLTVAGFTLTAHTAESLFAIAAASTLLLFIGIHNAWDTVTFLAIERWKARTDARPPAAPPHKNKKSK